MDLTTFRGGVVRHRFTVVFVCTELNTEVKRVYCGGLNDGSSKSDSVLGTPTYSSSVGTCDNLSRLSSKIIVDIKKQKLLCLSGKIAS